MSIDTEVVIVGAGPCGLFQVFELGLLGIEAHVVDSLAQTGGQCTMLYPEKPIYDIPAIPVCSAEELIERLEQQIKPFGATFHLGEEVLTLEALDDERFALTTSSGTELTARAVVVAGGVGSFQARPLRLPDVERFEGVNLHYKVTQAEQFRDKHVVILGGGDSALDWTLELATMAASVTLVHRREDFRATPASVTKMKQLAQASPANVSFEVARVKGFEEAHGRLSALQLESLDGEPSRLDLEELLVFYGLSPNLGPIAEWGLGVERRNISVDVETYQTNRSGIFAIGDINTYPGKKKLILSGFHEAALAAFAIQKRLFPERKQNVQYTTTSTLMHERLGVSKTES